LKKSFKAVGEESGSVLPAHHSSTVREAKLQLFRVVSGGLLQNSQRKHRDAAVIEAINAIIDKHPRWGFWKMFKVLRREHRWNHKRVYRIY